MKIQFRQVLFALVVAAAAPASRGDVAFVTNFEFYEAQQQTPVWCWAACIQMILNHSDVTWSQPDIVAAVKGYPKYEAGSDREIVGFLNSWGFDYDGRRWQARCLSFPGAPRPDWVVNELKEDRPIILSYQTGPSMKHVVILHKAEFGVDRMGQLWVTRFEIFDPYTAQNEVVDAAAFARATASHFFVAVRKLR
jgi:ABC-type bacteriocin/lantibiotic exporter with double-glycine peptidase domain